MSLFDNYHDSIVKVCSLERDMEHPLVSKVTSDEYTAIAETCFDYKFTGDSKFYPFKLPSVLKNIDFQILVICGSSGSGKSVFSKYFGNDESLSWDNSKAIISQIDSDPTIAQQKLQATGLNSIPVWCKPRNVLSFGEGFRADLARKLNDNCVIDEYTSVVDRDTALSCSISISKYIRKHNLKKCVFVSCHKDFIDCLCPDYVIDLDDEALYDCRGLLRRKFELQMFSIDDKERVWNIFRKYHYLSSELNVASSGFLLTLNNKIVACMYVLPCPGHNIYGNRIHRLVVLPEFQGMGIGSKFLDTMADILKYYNRDMYIRTSNVSLLKYLSNNSSYKCISNQTKSEKQARLLSNWKINNEDRLASSFTYIENCHNYPTIDYNKFNRYFTYSTRIRQSRLTTKSLFE